MQRRLIGWWAAVLIALWSAGCGGGSGGGGGGGGNSDATDLHISDLTTMTGNGDIMVHFTIRWDSTQGAAADDVAFRLQRADGSLVDEGTIATIASGQGIEAHASGMDLADGERLTLVLDPANLLVEDVEDNNSTTVTVMAAPMPSLTDGVDVRFNDAHYHQMYYFDDPMFHFFVMNPNQNGVAAEDVRFVIYDNGVAIHSGVIGSVPAPTPAEIAAGMFPSVEVNRTTDDLFGDDRSKRPGPGRHEFTIHLDPDNEIEELDETNNTFRMLVDVPEVHILAANPGPVPDIRLQDPHFHQYDGRAVFHFFVRNFHASTTSSAVRWRLVREDGVIIDEGVETIAPQGIAERSFNHLDDTAAEVVYRLIYDPDDEIEEVDEDNNQVQFIIDWSPTSWG